MGNVLTTTFYQIKSKFRNENQNDEELQAVPLLDYNVDFSNCKLTNDSLEGALLSRGHSSLEKAVVLRLNKNVLTNLYSLTEMCERNNRFFKKLKVLDVSNNGLVNIINVNFKKYFPQLEELYLQRNHLISIDTNTFPSNLKILDISKNNICFINKDNLPKSLEVLDTKDNLGSF